MSETPALIQLRHNPGHVETTNTISVLTPTHTPIQCTRRCRPCSDLIHLTHRDSSGTESHPAAFKGPVTVSLQPGSDRSIQLSTGTFKATQLCKLSCRRKKLFVYCPGCAITIISLALSLPFSSSALIQEVSDTQTCSLSLSAIL